MNFIQSFQKRKSTNKITFCDLKTSLEKQNEFKKHINNKRTKLNTEEDASSNEKTTTNFNLINTEIIAASISSIINTKVNDLTTLLSN